jgi:hypothetical protein
MLTSAPDQELLARQVALQAEAAQVLAESSGSASGSPTSARCWSSAATSLG